jgi:acyl-CoA thioesterase FadM
MTLFFRVLYVFLRYWLRPARTDILQPLTLRLRVLPNDLDTNAHMNNGRYLTIMDLGRLDLICRTGLLPWMRKTRGVPILAAAMIRYRLPLAPFQAYDLQTQIMGWDEKWLYLEQRFIITSGHKSGAVAAIALVRGSFMNPETKATIPTENILKETGYLYPSPTLPAHITEWAEAENALRAVTAS